MKFKIGDIITCKAGNTLLVLETIEGLNNAHNLYYCEWKNPIRDSRFRYSERMLSGFHKVEKNDTPNHRLTKIFK